MSKYIKFFALAGAALLLGACQEDLGLETGTITPGNEILFGANAYFENGEPQTRTEYGDIVGNQIEVLWVPGEDRMDIACPQAVGAPGHQAEYMVSADDATTAGSGDNKADNDKASILVRKSHVGLQWSTSRTHNFYAAYPSKNQIAERAVGKLPQDQIEKLGMTVSYDQETNEETATLRGLIPVDQSPAEENITGSATSGWEVKPDMTYAYMVANASHTYGAGSSVSLLFQPQVTALEFEIVSSDFTSDDQLATYPQFTILGAQVFSRSGKQMAGQFTYTFPLAGSGTGEFNTIAANGYEKISQTFGDGLLVAEGQSVKCTFFMLPGVAFNGTEDSEGDLGLTVIYRVGNSPQAKTATLKKEITPKKKYFFSNVKLPTIEEKISGSTWFSALAPQTLLSQVSIPVASNMFANPEYAKTNVNDFTTQQTAKLEDLWNMGVRGFELCNRSAAKEGNNTNTVQGKSLDDEGMVASENVLDVTFKDAIDVLYNCYKGTDEPLILICTYASTKDGYNPYHYIANLFNSLSTFCTRNSVDPSTFVQITSSSTAEDLKGKIAIVIRPGDDERWWYENKVNMSGYVLELDGTKEATTNPESMLVDVDINGYKTINSVYGLTNSIPYSKKCIEKEGIGIGSWTYSRDVDRNATLYDSEWWKRVLMVSDWGISSWDSWHRRGGKYYQYATTATNYDEIVKIGRTPISTAKYEDLILNGTAGSLTGYYYNHDMSNGATAYIQDLTRVMKSSIETTQNNKTYTWPESLSEKKAAIDGLFQLSVATKGNISSHDLYINVLSAYYGHEDHPVSLYPCYDAQGFKESGKGGDYLSAAKDLTTYVHGILSGDIDMSSATGTNKKLAQGPWGLVMMDYIGDASNTDSRKLVDLIMLNNFKFPLAMKTTTQNIPPTTPDEGDPNQPGQGNEDQGGSAD